jgi:hypothetical protein
MTISWHSARRMVRREAHRASTQSGMPPAASNNFQLRPMAAHRPTGLKYAAPLRRRHNARSVSRRSLDERNPKQVYDHIDGCTHSAGQHRERSEQRRHHADRRNREIPPRHRQLGIAALARPRYRRSQRELPPRTHRNFTTGWTPKHVVTTPQDIRSRFSASSTYRLLASLHQRRALRHPMALHIRLIVEPNHVAQLAAADRELRSHRIAHVRPLREPVPSTR